MLLFRAAGCTLFACATVAVAGEVAQLDAVDGGTAIAAYSPGGATLPVIFVTGRFETRRQRSAFPTSVRTRRWPWAM